MEAEKKPAVYLVGNTHFDPVWLWTWDEGMASIRSTFRSALDRMKEEEQFCYSFSCPPVFEWIRETEPSMFEEIRERVREGRWRLDEGMWLQPDCFSGCGESYIRQCLYGQRYLFANFGVYSDTAFNADCFGCPETMPQILKKSGMKYAIFGRPDGKDLPLADPLFRWRSPDGSEILACRVQDAGAPWSPDFPKALENALAWTEQKQKDALVILGVTDHGGAPTKRDIAFGLRKQAEGRNIVFSGTTEYFEKRKQGDLSSLRTVGEIPIRYFGVFCDLPAVKKENRASELALLRAERVSVLEKLLSGKPFPTALLAGAWKDVLFNQFHDILGGSSIRDAYTDAFHKWGHAQTEVNEYLYPALGRLTREISLPLDADAPWYLVVWNLHPFPVSRPVTAEVQWAWEFDWYKDEVSVTDADGREYPCQMLTPRTPIPGFRSRFVFEAEIPAFGYRVFAVHRRPAAQPENLCSVSESGLSNGMIRAEPDPVTGGIAGVWDELTGERLSGHLALPFVCEDTSDVWAFNFKAYGEREFFRVESVSVRERGPLFTRLHVKASYNRSVLDADYVLYRGKKEVEGSFRLFWQEEGKTCRFAFASCEDDPALSAASPLGETKREKNGAEMPAGGYLSFGDMTVYSDCFFSYTAEKNELACTAVRSPVYGDLRMGAIPDDDYEYEGQGILYGKWRVSLEKSTVYERQNAADAFLSPYVIINEAHHDGVRGWEDGFLRLTGNNVRLTALKPAEDGGDDIILRLVNVGGETETAQITLVGRSADFTLAPYEILTVRLGETIRVVDMLENTINRKEIQK